MGIGKAFKKAGKKLKKGAKKATGAVKDVAKDVEKGVNQGVDAVKDITKDVAKDVEKGVYQGVDAAKDLVDDAGKGLGEAIRRVEKLGDKAGDLAEAAYEEALQAGEAAWNATVDALERWFTDELVDLLLDAAMDAFRRQRELINAMTDAAHALLTDAKAASDYERVVYSAAGKKRDAKAIDSVRALAHRPEFQAIAKVCGKYNTASVGLASSAAYGAGAEGSFGYAFTLPDAKTVGGYFGVGGVVNSIGGSGAVQLATWNVKPADLKGPYFAATLEVEVKAGGGVSVVFAIPASESDWLDLLSGKTSPAPCGFVVFAGGGGELSASVSGGHTWVF